MSCRILCGLFLLILIGRAAAQDRVVTAVEFKGLKFVKLKIVKDTVKIKKGKPFAQSTVDEDIAGLFRTELFSDVSVDIQETGTDRKGRAEVSVIFLLTEKTLVKKIEFKGNRAFSNSKLLKELSLKPQMAYDAARAEKDAEKIATLYKDKGYTDVSVEHFVWPDKETEQSILSFFVREGKRVTLGQVTLPGAKAFSEKKVRKQMKTKRGKVYKEATLREDMEKILAFYKNRGYLDIQVAEPKIDYNEDRTLIILTLGLSEGSFYRNGEVAFDGNTLFSSATFHKAMGFKEGEIFNQSKHEESLGAIAELYSEKGYLRLRLDPEIQKSSETGIVNFLIHVTENNIVYVDRIYVDGNSVTRDYVVKREILVKEGDPFNIKKIRRSQERLLNLGFFADVTLDIQESPVPDKADLAISVEEQKTGILSLGAGFSASDSLVGTIQITQTNLFGRGQRLSLLWEFGARKQNYQISFTEPRFFGSNTSVGVDVFNLTRFRPFGTDQLAMKELRRGGNLRVGRNLSDFWTLNFIYGLEQIRIFDLKEEFKDRATESNDISSSLTSQVIRDTRDNVFDPFRGSRQSASFQISGGPILRGGFHFVKPSLSSSWFFPTFRIFEKPFVLSFNTEFAFVEPFTPSQDVPIFERFFLGGAESVRGYDFGAIGPPERGRVRFLFNTEYKYPLVREKQNTILQFATFFDMGGSWRRFRDVNFGLGTDIRQMKAGVGFGLRFRPTPVLPIRMDWGYGLNQIPGESRSQFYFTVGQIF